MTKPLYGGDVLSDDGTRLPFVIPGELVEVDREGVVRVLEASPERVEPRCPHFGRCGGCQYQMMAPATQLATKAEIIRELLHSAGCALPDDVQTHAGEPYGYRNRVRLRVERIDGQLRFGYSVRASAEFLPIVTCPIAAPVLWETAERLLALANEDEREFAWLAAAKEVQLFANDTLDKLQLTFFCPPRTRLPQGSFAKMMQRVVQVVPQVVGASADALDPRTGPTGRVLERFGAAGLSYRVRDESYWISRGGFFQVNRFLLPTLVTLVCEDRGGQIAWDLFAGVGLFSRVLARSFGQVTAVEANPTAAQDLTNSLRKLGPQHRAVQATTVDFLRQAVLERERPELVVLDPPRAGAGEEACELIARVRPSAIVYVSCDPTTLGRDWRVLEQHGYSARAMHLVELFPQTFHVETVVVFDRLP